MLDRCGGEPEQRPPLDRAMTAPSMVIHDTPPDVARTGEGFGWGFGNGCGSGDGDGSGWGCGSGSGYGYGYGNGSGDGDGRGWRALP